MSWFWSPYPKTVWWAKDVLWNAIGWGKRKQTISDRIGDKLRAGRLWARILDLPFMGHFRDTDEPHEVDRDSSARMLAFALGAIALLVVKWVWPEIVVRWVEIPYYAALLVWFLAQEGAKLLGRRPQ